LPHPEIASLQDGEARRGALVEAPHLDPVGGGERPVDHDPTHVEIDQSAQQVVGGGPLRQDLGGPVDEAQGAALDERHQDVLLRVEVAVDAGTGDAGGLADMVDGGGRVAPFGE
jgi:hypothetical protein